MSILTGSSGGVTRSLSAPRAFEGMMLLPLLLAAAQPPTRSVPRTCYLSVDRKVLVTGRCLVFPLGDNGYTLNTRDRGKPRFLHFAQVNADPGGRTGEAYWNKDPSDDHAQDPRGRVRWDGRCWIGQRTRLCAR